MVRLRLVVSSLLARMLWRFLTMRGKRRASRGGLYRTYSKESSYRASNPKWLMDVLKSTGGEVEQHVWEQCPDYQEYLRGDQEGAKCVLPLSPSCCERLFVLDPLVTYLNHGSYGATFRLALHTQQYVRDMMERQPVRFMETKALPGVLRALQLLAPWLGAASEDLVPVMNATSALSTVVRSMKLKKDDVIIMTSLTYPAVKSSLGDGEGGEVLPSKPGPL